MLDTIQNIPNPLIRAVAAAGIAFSIVTIATSPAIALFPNKEAAVRTSLYASAIAAGGGVVWGLARGKRSSGMKVVGNSTADNRQEWKDWRNLVVTKKVKESEEITSFYLQPQDSWALPDFLPGQFLTIQLEIPGERKPIIRTYSLSTHENNQTFYRLSIKREPAPKDLAVPPGLASNFMHDHVHEGAVLPAKPPSGRFFIDVNQSVPAILVSNGVGITPMISMAKACMRLNPARPVWFIHGARDGRYHAFRDEMAAVAQQSPNLHLHYRYSRPQPEDTGFFHSIGYVDGSLLQTLVSREAEFFLCGSPPFLQSIRDGLRDWGVPDHRVFYESFGGGKPKAAAEMPAMASGSASDGAISEVMFLRSQATQSWDASQGTLLEFAEAQGIDPPYSCRQGVCGTCSCKLTEGEVTYVEEPSYPVENGSVLICIAQPKSAKVTLDL